jgi:hypothetical protein
MAWHQHHSDKRETTPRKKKKKFFLFAIKWFHFSPVSVQRNMAVPIFSFLFWIMISLLFSKLLHLTCINAQSFEMIQHPRGPENPKDPLPFHSE